MVSGISSSTTTTTSSIQPQKPDFSQMYSDLSSKVDTDGDGAISKSDLESYLESLESSGSNDSKETEMISNMINDFDTLSGGSDTITETSFTSGMESLKPQGAPPQGAPPQGGQPPSTEDMYNDLSSKVDTDGDGISKSDLEAYLEELEASGSSDSKETEMISNLIDNFDEASGGTDTITADSLKSMFESQSSSSRYAYQDASTVTSDQLQSPIDLKV